MKGACFRRRRRRRRRSPLMRTSLVAAACTAGWHSPAIATAAALHGFTKVPTFASASSPAINWLCRSLRNACKSAFWCPISRDLSSQQRRPCKKKVLQGFVRAGSGGNCGGFSSGMGIARARIGCGWAHVGEGGAEKESCGRVSRAPPSAIMDSSDSSTHTMLGGEGNNIVSGASKEASSPRSRKVAVIGAGAAGLVAARELIREGHRVSVFEQTESVGGVWVYNPDIESDLLGTSTDRKRVHSSMYAALRTNLPREIMGFRDFPFLPKHERDDRRFPGHVEVALYLQEFAEFYGLLENVQFCTTVEYAGICQRGSETSWKVRTSRRNKSEGVNEDTFDAVVVCNGHYSEPKCAPISGISKWPGQQMHSHNYREPYIFSDQIVVVIGNAASGEDISTDIAQVAKEVHVSGRTWSSPVDFSEPTGQRRNIWRHSTVECACEDGTVKFKDGGSVRPDVILYCTGYFYAFPFLDTEGKVSVDNNCVGPLYEHVFPPALAPSLSFVGLPMKVVPFQLCELQSRWIAMAISGKVELPSPDEMMQSVEAFYSKLEASGQSKNLAHNMATTQFEYVDWLCDQTGSERVETWRREIFGATWRNKRENPNTYRDVWPDEDWHQEAYSCLEKIDKTRDTVSTR